MMMRGSTLLQRVLVTLKRVLRNRGLWALVAVLVIGAAFPGLSGKGKLGAFFTWDYHRDMLRENSIYGILACGMTIVILTAGIDLSVGSVLGMTGMLFAHFMVNLRLSPLVGIPVALVVGSAAGLLNGSVITTFKIQPFVVTLAMMVSARGLAKFVGGGAKIQAATEPPPIFDSIDSQILTNNLAIVTIIFVVSVAIFWFILNRTRFGRHLFAIGGNEEAARLSGVRVNRVKVTAYVISGLMSAMAGVCYTAQAHIGDPEGGAQAYELTAIAMVVIGGTSLMGGKGGVLMTVLGTLIIGYIEKILSINAVPIAYRLMVKGAIIVAAVVIQQTGRRTRKS